MRLTVALVATCLLASSLAEDFTTTDAYNDKLNAIEPKPSVRLDPYIRKALLKALSELEEVDNSTTGSEFTDGTTVDGSSVPTTSDAIHEDHTDKKDIQIHSFIVNGQSAFANNNTNALPIVESNISILSTTVGNVENQVTATLPTSAPFSEIFHNKDSEVNVQQTRSIHSSAKSNNDNRLLTKDTPKHTPITTSTSSTTTTTTTTTPKPTHNKDGENIEEVDKRDVQVFQAPLVAAFTVQQDSLGLPKKVIPLYQQTNSINTLFRRTPQTAALSATLPIVPPTTIPSVIPNINQNLPPNDFINHQLALQKQLEEKQRILEDQLRFLQIQQKQQEELLRKQQFLLQQKEQAQRQHFIGSKFQAQSSVNNFQIQKNIPQNTFVNQNGSFRPNNAQVSIQQSVPLEPNSLPTSQQLPNREAVDFLIHLRSQQPNQFPLQENHLPQGIGNFLQPSTNQQFQHGINFNQIRSISDPFSQQKQNNRVFRQESGVGNFGLNNQNYNTFNTFNPLQSTRFFPPHVQNQNHVDAELKQLLVQNGLNTRNQEDINIVSKVLSLNHGITLNNHISNIRPTFDSRRHIRPL